MVNVTHGQLEYYSRCTSIAFALKECLEAFAGDDRSVKKMFDIMNDLYENEPAVRSLRSSAGGTKNPAHTDD